MNLKKTNYFNFLQDVLLITLTAFGGPQAHLAVFHQVFVQKRGYLSESELLELNALCQILPGPSSTQTLTAIAYKKGGVWLALLTLLVWIFPAFVLMTSFAIGIDYFQKQHFDLQFMRLVHHIAIAFMIHSAWQLNQKTIQSKTALFIFLLSLGLSYFFPNPYIFPVILVLGGLMSSYKFDQQPKQSHQVLHIKWNYLLWYGSVFVGFAVLGGLTNSLPIRLFENFYRNGSLIFGGGQVLVPALYNEFVEFKNYLTADEFLSGYALVQAIPGPVFSFSAYIGALSMRHEGILGSILGGLVATVGINLAGTFLIFFVINFWEGLKKYRFVRASLEGITAAAAGMMVTAVLLLLPNLEFSWLNLLVMGIVLFLRIFSTISAPYLIAAGLVIGFLF